MIQKAIRWYTAPTLSSSSLPDEVAPTRDVFQARLDRLYREVVNRYGLAVEGASLIAAVSGEIGNNCFDHNLGQWKDQSGCWFTLQQKNNLIFVCISDRGQGVLASLRRVVPGLNSEEEALKLAFEKRLSGRSPEQRGNGLKFVRAVINGNANRSLLFCSGCAIIQFGKRTTKIAEGLDLKKGTGTFAVIEWIKK